MKTLLVLRHAKSSWGNEGLSDYERPLNKRGKRDAPRMGRLLEENELTPDLIIASSAKRALSTAEAVALACDFDHEIQFARRFYLADASAYIEALQAIGDVHRCVMVVGHNPGMEHLVALLSGYWERMPTAAIAHINLPIAHWRELDEGTEGELVDLWRPKEV